MDLTINMGEDGNIGSYRCQRNGLRRGRGGLMMFPRLTPLGSSISVAVNSSSRILNTFARGSLAG